MRVTILGPGCTNCRSLEARTREALAGLGVEATVEKVTDFAATAGYGVLRTPGLALDDRVLVSGRVPSVEEIAGLLRSAG